MVTIKPQQSPSPFAYGPQTFTDLLLGFMALGAIGAAIYVVFHLPYLFSAGGALLAGVVTGPFASVGEMLASVALGALAGVAVGAIRLKLRSRVVDELVGAVLAPETLTAAKVGWAAAALAVAISVGSGLAVGRLGVVGVEVGASTVVGPLLTAACLWGCPPGAGDGDLFVTFVAIVLIVIVLTLVLSIGVTAIFAAAGKGLVAGAAQGTGHALGLAIVLMLTRLRTTGLTDAGHRGTPGKLTFDARKRAARVFP
jgi:hypothetical protein